jgi:hypothetical protein
MVLIENEINNWRIKVYGAPDENGNENAIVYYRVIEEPVFSETGDCIMIVSNHTVSLNNENLTPAQAHSLLPLYRVREQLVIHATDEPVKYISFILPRALKDRLEGEQLENQSGLTF